MSSWASSGDHAAGAPRLWLRTSRSAIFSYSGIGLNLLVGSQRRCVRPQHDACGLRPRGSAPASSLQVAQPPSVGRLPACSCKSILRGGGAPPVGHDIAASAAASPCDSGVTRCTVLAALPLVLYLPSVQLEPCLTQAQPLSRSTEYPAQQLQARLRSSKRAMWRPRPPPCMLPFAVLCADRRLLYYTPALAALSTLSLK